MNTVLSWALSQLKRDRRHGFHHKKQKDHSSGAMKRLTNADLISTYSRISRYKSNTDTKVMEKLIQVNILKGEFVCKTSAGTFLLHTTGILQLSLSITSCFKQLMFIIMQSCHSMNVAKFWTLLLLTSFSCTSIQFNFICICIVFYLLSQNSFTGYKKYRTKKIIIRLICSYP